MSIIAMGSPPTSSVSIIDNSVPFFIRGEVLSDPGNTVSVFSFTVPSGTTRRMKRLWVTTEIDGLFSLEIGGSEVAAGRLSNVARNVDFPFDPPYPVTGGTTVELKFYCDLEPDYDCPIIAFLSASDFI